MTRRVYFWDYLAMRANRVGQPSYRSARSEVYAGSAEGAQRYAEQQVRQLAPESEGWVVHFVEVYALTREGAEVAARWLESEQP